MFSAGISFASGQISPKEKSALVNLYNSTNGEDWNVSWDLTAPVDTWKGVEVDNGHVVGLTLFMNNLNGVLPESIGDLRHLSNLNLAFNQITGVLPKDIVKLEKLKVFRLEMNRIKGGIPTGVANFKELEVFSMFNNFLTGPIPETFGELKS